MKVNEMAAKQWPMLSLWTAVKKIHPSSGFDERILDYANSRYWMEAAVQYLPDTSQREQGSAVQQ